MTRLAHPTASPAAAEPGDCCLQENHQGGDQQYGASDDKAEPNADLADLFRHLGPGELSFLPDERGELVHQIDKDSRDRPTGFNVRHGRPP